MCVCVDTFNQVREFGKSLQCNVMKISVASSLVYLSCVLLVLTLYPLLGVGSAGGVRGTPSQILWCRVCSPKIWGELQI